MTNQCRMPKHQAIIFAAMLPVLILVRVGITASLPWAFIIAAVLFSPAAVAFVLLWLIKPEDQSLHFNDYYPVGILVSVYSIFPLIHALFILRVPQRFGFDFMAAALFGFMLWVLVIIPFVLLSARKLSEPPDEEFKQAHYLARTGWGLTPAGALKKARTYIAPGITAGIGCIGAGWAIFFGSGLSEQQGKFVYLGFALLVLLGSASGLCFCLYKGLRFWRVGQAWGEQATGTITVRGIYADWWIEENAGDTTLVKLKLRDGTTKILLVEPAFLDLLPEEGKEVEIDYLMGCEAVVGVKAL